MRAKITEWILSVVFFIIGAGIMVLGVYIQIDSRSFQKEAVKASAKITEINERRDSDGDIVHDVYVAFTVDGERYSGALGEYSVGMREGGITTVYYKPDNPGNFRGPSSGFLGLIITGFGLIFFLVGGLQVFFKIKNRISANKLLETGRRVDANIDSVTYNYSYRVNGRHPMVIQCTYVDPFSRKVFTFQSENLWFNAEAVIQSAGLATMPVYMDEAKPSRYYVDTDILKNYLGN